MKVCGNGGLRDTEAYMYRKQRTRPQKDALTYFVCNGQNFLVKSQSEGCVKKNIISLYDISKGLIDPEYINLIENKRLKINVCANNSQNQADYTSTKQAGINTKVDVTKEGYSIKIKYMNC